MCCRLSRRASSRRRLRSCQHELRSHEEMTVRYTNGSWVSRIWGDGSGESIAQFQYFGDACRYAEAKAAENDRPPDCFYVACHTLDGEMKIDRQPSESGAMKR